MHNALINDFHINASSSDVAKATVLSLLKNGFVAKTANINYSPSKGLPYLDGKNYPLTMYGNFGGVPTTVRVYSVTAGYGGEGPHTLCEILNSAGFIFSEKDILTDQKINSTDGVIHLFYTR